MLKKILLGFAALVLLAVAVVGWTVVRPIYQLAQEISPSTAPKDYAKQDDSRVQLPTPRELEPRPYDPLKNVCPNCGGGFCPRPVRPRHDWVGGNSLDKYPAGERLVHKPVDREAHPRLLAAQNALPPHAR